MAPPTAPTASTDLHQPPARPPGAPAVRAGALTKRFDADPVVSGVDLQIDDGCIVGLIGPSGCGKTTTVRLLAGLLAPTSGTAEVYGTPAVELSASARSQIGYLPQVPALFPDLSVLQNLGFHAAMYGLPVFRRRRHLRRLLDWVELDGDRRKRVRDVSGGMQRRLALAAAFVHAPRLVFLDEPTAGIDPILREKFWQEFRRLADAGRTLIVTTQYVGEASSCDYVGLLSDGELLMFDTPEHLRRAAFGGEVIDATFTRPPDDVQMAELAGLPGVIGEPERTAYDTVRFVVDDADATLDRFRDGIDRLGLDAIEVVQYTVDDDEAFVRLVERHRTLTGHDEEATDGVR